MSDAKSVVINLTILGSVEKDMKLNTKEKFFVLDPYDWMQGFWRLIRRDDRTITGDKISLLIRNTQDLLEKRIEGPKSLDLKTYDELCVYLEPILQKARDGLRNLIQTYENDKTFVAQIEIEIGVLERLIQKCKKEKSEEEQQQDVFLDTIRNSGAFD